MEKEEYAVYVYYKENKNDTRLAKWERVSATSSSKRAIKHARLLRRKKRYERIEVQKKMFDKVAHKAKREIIHTSSGKDTYWEVLFRLLSKHKA